MTRYRVVRASDGWPETLPFAVQTADGRYEIGDEFDAEFPPDDEASALASGVIEVIPRTYKVIGDSDVFETKTGDTFDAAMSAHTESLLIDGGYIERVDLFSVFSKLSPKTKTTPKEK